MTRNKPDLLSYGEARQLLNLRPGTLYALVSQRRIPHVRLGGRLVRFVRADLDQWIAARRVAVGGRAQ